MSLQIKNIKTDKEKYIFGEDKNISLTFELVSDNKDYNLNSVFIKYGYQIFKGKTKLVTKTEIIYLEELLFVNGGNAKTFSCLVPIIIPNTNIFNELNNNHDSKKLFYNDYYNDLDILKIKNFIEIIADIKLNPIDCKGIYYPNIELVKLDNIDNDIDSDSYKILDEANKMIVIKDKSKYDFIQNEINLLYDKLTKNNNKVEADKINYEISLKNDELKKYYILKDEKKYNELLDKADTIMNKDLEKIKEGNLFKFDEYLVEKNDPNYIKISNGIFGIGQDYVNIDFYNFLLEKYNLFKFFRFFNIKIISIIFAILFFLFISIDYFKEYFLILLGIFIFIFLPILYIKNNLIRKISKEIINIRFKNINFITENLKNKTLKFKDIYDDISINYYGKYNCNFNSNLDCILKLSIQEGKHTRTYEENIFSINLGSYQGNNLSINNIILNDKINILEKLFIKPGYINKKTFFSLSSGKYEIFYKISYNFNSPDLINRNGQLIIK